MGSLKLKVPQTKLVQSKRPAAGTCRLSSVCTECHRYDHPPAHQKRWGCCHCKEILTLRKQDFLLKPGWSAEAERGRQLCRQEFQGHSTGHSTPKLTAPQLLWGKKVLGQDVTHLRWIEPQVLSEERKDRFLIRSRKIKEEGCYMWSSDWGSSSPSRWPLCALTSISQI